MKKKHNFSAIIARGGSVRLPCKNKLKLNGLPLFVWTVNAALESGMFEQVWLSSDDPEILETASAIQGVSIDERPPELSGPDVKGTTVLEHIIDKARQVEPEVDNFCLLQPTSPFRQASDIKKVMAVLEDNQIDMSIGIQEFTTPVHFALNTENGLFPVNKGYLTKKCSTQKAPKSYHPAGGIYAGRIKVFLSQKHFYGDRSRGVILDQLSGWDINSDQDFRIATAIATMIENNQTFNQN